MITETPALSESEKAKEDWMNKKWRPAMGWMYMTVCVFDFIIAPILWAILQFWETQAANDAFRQWQPLTLQGAGLFHMAMGAVLGLAAWGRTQEKLNGATTGPAGLPSSLSATPSNYSMPTSAPVASTPSYTPSTPQYTAAPPTYKPAAPAQTQPITYTAGGKKVVPQEPEPEI